MTINELQNNVIEEFADFDAWMDKYALLIDLGNSLPPLEEKYKTESNLIEGCQSRVWLQADYVDGKILFKGESDAVIVKGIVSLLISILSDHTPQELLSRYDELMNRYTAGGGYEADWGTIKAGPFAALDYAFSSRPSLTEDKGMGSRLHLDSETFHSLRSSLGVRMSTNERNTPPGRLTPPPHGTTNCSTRRARCMPHSWKRPTRASPTL